ncbi:MAG: response regulator [Blastocatellia bacterium]|nr:response regulator [Blastocatellia bacterium]
MCTQLRVLIVDDSTNDAILIERELRRGGYDLFFKRVDTAADMEAALDGEEWDAVVADYVIPGFGGLAALALLKEKGLDLPFVIVSGALGEETAVEVMRAGAHDYIMKDRLARLVPAIEREANVRRERKRADSALRESEARFKRLVEPNIIGIIVADTRGSITEANDAFLKMVGYAREELPLRWDEMTPPEYRPGDEEVIERLKVSDIIAPFEKEYIRKDGSRVPVLIGGSLLESSRDDCICFVIDLTERKRLERQLHQSQKMEAIGRLAGGVAHDFNNLLTAITGYSDLLLMRLSDTDPQHSSLQEIKNAGDRAAALTRRLLVFSHKQVLQPKVLDLGETIASSVEMLRRLIGERVELVTVLDPNLGRVKADPAQMEEVIMNLATNARDAMPEGGKLIIEAANIYLDEAYGRSEFGTGPGHYVMLSVADTGCGMDEETRSHLFEPFFTTKEKGKGTGLGLSTVYGIVKQSGGHIKAYSETGIGTTFKIFLPRVEGEADSLRVRASGDEMLRGSETVLLVEDEEIVRRLARNILDAGGYRVLEAADAAEALEICERCEDQIDLMLTDVVMPRMNGFKLAERATILRPAMKVLYMSGYTGNALFNEGVAQNEVAFLQKPFTAYDLTYKLREVLDGRREEQT